MDTQGESLDRVKAARVRRKGRALPVLLHGVPAARGTLGVVRARRAPERLGTARTAMTAMITVAPASSDAGTARSLAKPVKVDELEAALQTIFGQGE